MLNVIILYDRDFIFTLSFGVRYPPSGSSNSLDQSSHLLTVATRDLFSELDKNMKPVAPMQFWMVQIFFSPLCVILLV